MNCYSAQINSVKCNPFKAFLLTVQIPDSLLAFCDHTSEVLLHPCERSSTQVHLGLELGPLTPNRWNVSTVCVLVYPECSCNFLWLRAVIKPHPPSRGVCLQPAGALSGVCRTEMTVNADGKFPSTTKLL